MGNLSNLILLSVYVVLLTHCGNSGVHEETPPNNTKNYHFTTNDCDTLEHVFANSDQKVLLLDYCAALLDDKLNNHCASEQRLSLFEIDCSEVKAQLLAHKNPPNNPSHPGNSPTSELELGYGVPNPEHSVAKTDSGQAEILQKFAGNWVKKTASYSFRVTDQNQNDINNFLKDLEDCGFNFAGPLCREGQKTVVRNLGQVLISNKTYLYSVVEYSEQSQRFVFFLNMEAEGANSGLGYIYLLTNPEMAHSPEDILSEKAGLAIAQIEHIQLNLNTAQKILSDSFNTVQRLSILHLIIDAAGTIPTPTEKNAVLKQLLDILNHDEKTILATINARVYFLYFKARSRLESKDQLTTYLTAMTQSKTNLLADEAIIALVDNEVRDKATISNFFKLMTNKDVNVVKHALFILKQIPLAENNEIINKLIELLPSQSISIRTQANLLLTSIKFTKDQIPSLISVINSKNSRDLTPQILALTFLSRLEDPLARTTLIGFISHKNDKIAEEAYALLERSKLSDQDLPALRKNIESGATPLERIRSSQLTGKISSPQSTLVLTQNMSQPNDLVHNTIITILDSQAFSDLHVADLEKTYALPNTLVSQKALEYLLRIRTSNCYNALLRIITNKSSAEVRTVVVPFLIGGEMTIDNIKSLKDALASNFDEVRQMSFNHLTTLNMEESIIALIESMNNAYKDTQTQIINYVKSQVVKPSFAKALSNTMSSYKAIDEVKFVCVNMIVQINTDEATNGMVNALDNSLASIRTILINALDKRIIPASNNGALEILYKGYYYDDWDYEDPSQYPEVRRAAVRYIFRIGSASFVREAIYNLSGYDDDVADEIAKQIMNVINGHYSYELNKEHIGIILDKVKGYNVKARKLAAQICAYIPTETVLNALKTQLGKEEKDEVKSELIKSINTIEAVLTSQ